MGCKALIDALPFLSLPSVFFGGALVWDPVSKVPLRSVPCDPSVLLLVDSILRRFRNVSVTVYSAFSAWTYQSNRILEEKGVAYDRSAPVVSSLPSGDLEILKVLLTCEDPSVLSGIQRDLIDPEVFHGVFASTHFFEITAASVDKGSAVSLVRALSSGLSDYRFWAAGDAPSDLLMRRAVDGFACPRDAHPSLIPSADFVFPSAGEEGIISLLRYLKAHPD